MTWFIEYAGKYSLQWFRHSGWYKIECLIVDRSRRLFVRFLCKNFLIKVRRCLVLKSERRTDMNMKKILVGALFTVLACAVFADTRTTYRDAMGRVQGTVSTDRYGTTTYRDNLGRVQGTETTDRYGKTTYRDAGGRVMRTESTDRYGTTTYRDNLGRVLGTETTDRYGTTTYRDAQGRIQGSSTTDRYGTTTYRDAQGRIQGTKK